MSARGAGGRWRGAGSFVILLALLAGGGACSHFVILHDPLTAKEHNDLGVAYESSGRLDLAKREYRHALRLEPDLAIARVNLGNVEAAKERWRAAEREYRRALRVAPGDPQAMNNLAWALYRQGRRLDEAERFARRAVATADSSDTTYAQTLKAIVSATERKR